MWKPFPSTSRKRDHRFTSGRRGGNRKATVPKIPTSVRGAATPRIPTNMMTLYFCPRQLFNRRFLPPLLRPDLKSFLFVVLRRKRRPRRILPFYIGELLFVYVLGVYCCPHNIKSSPLDLRWFLPIFVALLISTRFLFDF